MIGTKESYKPVNPRLPDRCIFTAADKPSYCSIHKKMGSGSGELPYLAVFRDFHRTQCSAANFEI